MSEIEFHFGDKSGELDGEALEEVRSGSYRQESQAFLDYFDSSGIDIEPDMAFHQEGDILNSALVAAGEKDGMMLRATLLDRGPLQKQIEAINSIGLDCFLVPETIDVEGEVMDNSAVYVTNKHEYRDASEDELPFTDGAHEDDEGLGEFFGYPKAETEAFIEHGMWPHGFTYESGEGRPIDYESGTEYVFPPHMIGREHGVDQDTVDKLQSLVNYAIRDDSEAVEEAVETAESRYETLQDIEEEYGVGFTDLV